VLKQDNVLEIDNITFGYNNQKLIYKDFSLSLSKNQIISIVGESGSGKSTLFDLIVGELKPQNGEIKTKKISEVFQDPYSSFHPSHTIFSQIKDVAKLDRLEKLLQMLNLDITLLNKTPDKLSGGQLQRASILRAFLMEPALLLLDEPTSALDNIIQLEVMKLLVTSAKSFGVLLITHDESLAKWCSDKIIYL